MTAGITGDPLSTVLASSHRNTISYRREWSGADGKSEIVSGVPRTKWNNYSASVNSRRRREDKYEVTRWVRHLGTGQPFPIPGSGINPASWSLSVTHDFPANDQLKLLEKLVQKVKGFDFNLGVNLAQMRQVSSMVDVNLRKITGALWDLRKGRFADAARQLGARPKRTNLRVDDLSGRWLELQYGWLPLISDTFNAAKAFEAISQGPQTRVVRVSHKKTRLLEASTSPSTHTARYEKTTRRSLIYEMAEELSVARQLGLLDPLSVAWEILPWSFVIDWFIPIGSYLDMVNQIPHLKGRFLQTTVTKAKNLKDMRWLGGTKPSNWLYDEVTLTPDQGEYFCRVLMDREVLGSPPTVPPPTFSLTGAVEGTRVWNAIALAQQVVSKIARSG